MCSKIWDYSFSPHCDAAIGQYLLENQDCDAAYSDTPLLTLAIAKSSSHSPTHRASFIEKQTTRMLLPARICLHTAIGPPAAWSAGAGETQ